MKRLMITLLCTLPGITLASSVGVEIINNTDHTCFLVAEENYSGIPWDGPPNILRSHTSGDLVLWKNLLCDQPETRFTYSCDLKEITINTKYLPTEDETGDVQIKLIRSAPGISASIEVVDESSRDNKYDRAKVTINQ